MANVVHAYIPFINVNGEIMQAEILGPGSGITPVELQAGYPAAVIRWSRNEDQIFTDPIMYSEAEIMILHNGEATDLLEDIAAADDNTWSLRIMNTETDPAVLYWCGVILSDSLEEELDPKNRAFRIRAADGLKTLADTKVYNTDNEFGKNFYAMLNSLVPYTDNFGVDDQSVFYSPQFLVSGAANQVFKDVRFIRDFDSDLDYLKAILNDLGMYLIHANGYYYILGILDLSGGSFSGSWYKENGVTVLSSTTLNYSVQDVDINTGGIRRFTRPYKEVRLSYNSSSEFQKLEKTTTATGSTTTQTLLSIAKIRPDKPYHLFTIEGRSVLEASPSNLTDTRNIEIQVIYGSKYLQDAGTWTTVNTWIPLAPDFAGVAAKSIAGINYEIDLSTAGVTSGAFSIAVRFSSQTSGGSGNLSKQYTILNLRLRNEPEDELIYETGATGPHLEAPLYFVAENVLQIDGMISTGLGGFIGDGWAYGVDTGKLHELKATQLKLNGTDPQQLIEGYIDNNKGPAQLYDILAYRVLPVRIDQDLHRLEGRILGWKIGNS